MADMINFKVYLTKENAEDRRKPEIRRFGIDFDVVTNFTYLREKLQAVFPELKGKRFVISWKDHEDDDIIVSSCEELQIALTETQNWPVRKLYVTLCSEYDDTTQNHAQHHFTSSENQSPKSKARHVGVVCDGCDNNILGFRYKCLQCPDYDLCSNCEAKCMHPEHCMIRIPMPLEWRSHHGKRLSHHINKFMRKSTCPMGGEFKNRKCGFPQNPNYDQGSSWLDSWVTYLNDWANLPGECPAMNREQKEEASGEQSQPGQSKSAPESPTTTPLDNDNSEDPQVQFLRNIGKTISKFLDPLGVDVNVQVKTDIKTPTPSGKNSSENSRKNSDATAKNDDKSSSQEKPDEKTTTKTKDYSQKTDDLLNLNIPNTPKTADNAEAVKTSPVNDDASKNDGWTLLDNSGFPTPVASRNASPDKIVPAIQSAPVAPAVPVAQPAAATPVAQPKPSTPAQNNTEKAGNGPIYPTLPNISDNVWHPNPRIQKAVEQIMQMGFTNENGWLTQLVLSKNGDVTRTLEVLLTK